MRVFVESLSSLWGDGYWVTWHPSIRHTLGDVGSITDGRFVGTTTLRELEISSKAGPVKSRDDLTWRSEGGIDVQFKAAGQMSEIFTSLAPAQAGALVKFTRENGILVSFRGLSETRLLNQPTLAQGVLSQYWSGAWPPAQVVISHLVRAESGTVLMANDRLSSIELAAESSLGLPSVGLTDLSSRLQVSRSSGLGLELIGSSMTPFFQVLGLKKSFLRGVEAIYGDGTRLRGSSARPLELPPELVEEAIDEPDAVLEAIPPHG